MPEKELVAVGKITGSHGVRGYTRVLPLTDDLDRLKLLKEVYLVLDSHRQKIEINHVRLNYHKNTAYILFSDIESLEQAKLLVGKYIMIPMTDVLELPANHYYHFQIIGLKVFSLTGEYLGRIEEILETGANDVYLLGETTRKKHVMIPALKDIVKNIDLDKRVMLIDPPPGLLDD